MASEILFSFYDIFVTNIFGSVGLAILAIAGIIAMILFLCRAGWTFISFWMVFYFLVMGTMYIGALGLVLAFFIISAYTVIAFMRLVAGTWLNI